VGHLVEYLTAAIRKRDAWPLNVCSVFRVKRRGIIDACECRNCAIATSRRLRYSWPARPFIRRAGFPCREEARPMPQFSNAPILASSELLETLQGRAYVRVRRRAFPNHRGVGAARDRSGHGVRTQSRSGRQGADHRAVWHISGNHRKGDHVTDPWLLQIGACAARLEQTRMARAL